MSVVEYKGKEYKATGSNLLRIIRKDNDFTYERFNSVEKYFQHKNIIFTNFSVDQAIDLFDGLRENMYSSYNLSDIFLIYKKYAMSTDRIRKKWVVGLLGKRKGKKSSNSEEFYRQYFEEDYAEAMEKCRNLPPRNYDKETWITKGYSEACAIKKVSEIKCKTAGNLASFIRRYGEELGNQKYTEFRNSVSYSNTLGYYIERFGKVIGTKKYEDKNSENSFTSSYEGHKKNGTLEIYRERNKRRSAANKYETLIEKFGEDKAREILFARAGFTRAKRHKTSTVAYRFFLPIYKFLRRNGINRDDILWGIGDSREKLLYNENSKLPKLYDFCVESLKFIVEFDGAAWHPQKENMTRTEWETWKTPFGKTADEQHNNDRLKDNIANKSGYSLFRVHENDKNRKQEELLEILKDKIYENNKNNKR